MSLIGRLGDEIRRIVRTTIPGVTEGDVAVLESELVDLFVEYAAEHYKLVREDP